MKLTSTFSLTSIGENRRADRLIPGAAEEVQRAAESDDAACDKVELPTLADKLFRIAMQEAELFAFIGQHESGLRVHCACRKRRGAARPPCLTLLPSGAPSPNGSRAATPIEPQGRHRCATRNMTRIHQIKPAVSLHQLLGSEVRCEIWVLGCKPGRRPA